MERLYMKVVTSHMERHLRYCGHCGNHFYCDMSCQRAIKLTLDRACFSPSCYLEVFLCGRIDNFRLGDSGDPVREKCNVWLDYFLPLLEPIPVTFKYDGDIIFYGERKRGNVFQC